MLRTSIIAAACLAASAATVSNAGAPTEPIQSELFVGGFVTPLEMVQNPTNPAIQYVVQQNGLIRVINNGVVQATSFLNVQSRISTGGERGLLGMALDPDFASNRRFYINYTNPAGNTHVASYTANNNLSADFNSENVILVVTQDFSNHNGGCLRTGPDGMLYISLGDGGSGGDPFNRGQTRTQLLGKILRIDPSSDDFPADPNRDYAIPAGNPYVGHPTFRPEIWSYGVRNIWKFTFDEGPCGTGAMLMGDVGQNAREEVNYEPAGAGGRNYGWDCREGLAAFGGCAPPVGESFTDPVYDYLQSSFGRSITGGYVYRGADMANNRGRYYFADFITGRTGSIALDVDPMTGEATASDFIEHTSQLGSLGNISAFGRDAAGELYALSFNGNIYRIRGTAKTGDANLDGVVNASDLAAMLAAWGDSSCGVSDIDNDENVGASDLAALLANWG